MSLEWSHREEEILIDFFAKHESLHNKHHADYNYNHKNKLLAELVRQLNKQSSGKKFKVDIVSKHWNELRNIYNQHKRSVIKNELTRNKNAQSEPDWIWWTKMNNLFTGGTDTDNSNRWEMSFTSNIVHQSNSNDVLSQMKGGARSKALVQDLPKVNVTNFKRRATIEPPSASEAYVSPIKVTRRRTIHPLPLKNKVEESSPSNCEDSSESEIECKVKVIPITEHGKMLPSRVVTKPLVVSTVEERISPTNSRGRRNVKIQSKVTSMEVDPDVDTSDPKSANDECVSTAMFVESRLRSYDDYKRQRMIFKIHELFYQEGV